MIETRWPPDHAMKYYEGMMIAMAALRGRVDDHAYDEIYEESLDDFTEITG